MSRVVEAIRAFPGLSGPGVVAVSGGADSVALLRGLLDAGAGPLTVAHFNHHLRGAESDADAAFVRELASGLGLPFRLGEADVRAAAAGDNLEATARRLRYDWLAGLGGEWVATGHTADDQAETVLHRIIRGTGLQGLRGIATERLLLPSPLGGEGLGVRGEHLTPPPGPLPEAGRGSPAFLPSPLRGGAGGGGRLVRPLLTVTRTEVLDYLCEIGQPFREDATNADPAFTRNRIRHELLPLLKTFNPAVVSALCRMADQAEAATAELDLHAARLLTACELPRAGELLVFDAFELAWVSDHGLGEMFRRVWEREGWPLGEMTAAHWRRLERVVAGNPLDADFPGGVHVRRVGRVVQLGRRS